MGQLNQGRTALPINFRTIFRVCRRQFVDEISHWDLRMLLDEKTLNVPRSPSEGHNFPSLPLRFEDSSNYIGAFLPPLFLEVREQILGMKKDILRKLDCFCKKLGEEGTQAIMTYLNPPPSFVPPFLQKEEGECDSFPPLPDGTNDLSSIIEMKLQSLVGSDSSEILSFSLSFPPSRRKLPVRENDLILITRKPLPSPSSQKKKTLQTLPITFLCVVDCIETTLNHTLVKVRLCLTKRSVLSSSSSLKPSSSSSLPKHYTKTNITQNMIGSDSLFPTDWYLSERALKLFSQLLVLKSEWLGSVVMRVSTPLREYTGLVGVSNTNFFRLLAQNKKEAALLGASSLERAERESGNCRSDMRDIPNDFNESQKWAISIASDPKRTLKVLLLQGPPGESKNQEQAIFTMILNNGFLSQNLK